MWWRIKVKKHNFKKINISIMQILGHNKMPSKRTGLIPSKKNFTAVGGVGARPFSMQNKISMMAPHVAGAMPPQPAPAPAPPQAPPTQASIDRLFNIDSFSKTFSGTKDSRFPDKQLTPVYIPVLAAATTRWTNFLSFHPDGLNTINAIYKKNVGKDWKGFELVAVNNSYKGKAIASISATRFSNIPYGFALNINTTMLLNGWTDPDDPKKKHYTFSLTNLEHVFAHELGHVLGLCNLHSSGDIVRLPTFMKNVDYIYNGAFVYKRFGVDLPFGNMSGRLVISARQFPQTHSEHNKLINKAARLTGGGPLHIMLSDDEMHWNQTTVSLEVHAWGIAPGHDGHYKYNPAGMQHFPAFYNELMAPGFNPQYDDTNGYFISSKSLKYLTEMRLNGNRMYVEKSPGASEVSGVIEYGKLSNLSLLYIMTGKAGGNFPAIKGIATVERTLLRDADADATDAHAYNVFYPDGYAGDRNDEEEIIQIVKNHERIVNDPAFVEFKCCS